MNHQLDQRLSSFLKKMFSLRGEAGIPLPIIWSHYCCLATSEVQPQQCCSDGHKGHSLESRWKGLVRQEEQEYRYQKDGSENWSIKKAALYCFMKSSQHHTWMEHSTVSVCCIYDGLVFSTHVSTSSPVQAVKKIWKALLTHVIHPCKLVLALWGS